MNNIVIARAACRIISAFFLCLCLALAFGCYPSALRPTKVPLTIIHYDARQGTHQQLIVYLPGNGDDPSAFDHYGLREAITKRGVAIDIVAVDAYLAYYAKGIIFTRLKEDVIDPAKARGYKDIWLVGNSLGAYGSITYARMHPQDIAGIVLLGPFLGDKKLINGIIDAGGLQKWDPGIVGDNSQEDWDKQLWLWLKNGLRQEGSNARMPKVYLGYGKYDRFSYGQKVLAGVLPPERVVSLSGGHDWSTWREAWDILLGRMLAEDPGLH